MHDVSFIVCPNGFGHFRRFIFVCNELKKNNITVKIYTDKSKFNNYINSRSIENNFSIENISWLPIAQDYKDKNFFLNNFKNLCMKIKSPLIVSDNYIEPLLFKKDAFVIANFLFHEEMLNESDEYFKNLNKIDYEKANIFSSIFAMNYMNQFKKVQKLSLVGQQYEQLETNDHIILSKGLGCWSDDFDKIVLEYSQKNLSNYKGIVYIDQSLIGIMSKLKLIGLSVKLSSFKIDLISRASAIIGRPSIGILTESFEYRIPFIPLVGSNDNESSNNYSILQNLYNDINLSFEFQERKKNLSLLKSALLPLGGQVELVKHIIFKLENT